MPRRLRVPTQSPTRVSTTSGSPVPSHTRWRTVQRPPSLRRTPPRAGTLALHTAQMAGYRLTELIRLSSDVLVSDKVVGAFDPTGGFKVSTTGGEHVVNRPPFPTKFSNEWSHLLVDTLQSGELLILATKAGVVFGVEQFVKSQFHCTRSVDDTRAGVK